MACPNCNSPSIGDGLFSCGSIYVGKNLDGTFNTDNLQISTRCIMIAAQSQMAILISKTDWIDEPDE